MFSQNGKHKQPLYKRRIMLFSRIIKEIRRQHHLNKKILIKDSSLPPFEITL